jgi:antirestriction protein ArdC
MAKYKENRQKLIELSIKAREIREDEGLGDSTINEIIRLYFYTDDTHQVFNTFWEWKDKGYKVKKGEKAFLFWGSKRKNKQDDQAQSQEEETYSFFPLCYVFSNAQVEPIAKN